MWAVELAAASAAALATASVVASAATWAAGSAAVLPEQAAGSAAPAAPVVLYYYDPMHPETHFDRPGKSPFMDMELVPKYAAVLGAGGVVVSAAVSAVVSPSYSMRSPPAVPRTLATR